MLYDYNENWEKQATATTSTTKSSSISPLTSLVTTTFHHIADICVALLVIPTRLFDILRPWLGFLKLLEMLALCVRVEILT